MEDYERLIKRAHVEQITGLSRSSLYSQMAKGVFPRPVKIGERAVAWREGDIRAWIAQRPSTDAA